MLIAVKRAFRSAERIVLDDDAELWTAARLGVARDECRRQTGRADLHVEVVLPEIVGEHLHRPLLLEADFGMTRDVVAEREELGVHELFGARDDLIALRTRRGHFRDECGKVERLLEGVELADDVAGGVAFSGCFLGGERRDWKHRNDDCETSTRQHGTSRNRVVEVQP